MWLPKAIFQNAVMKGNRPKQNNHLDWCDTFKWAVYETKGNEGFPETLSSGCRWDDLHGFASHSSEGHGSWQSCHSQLGCAGKMISSWCGKMGKTRQKKTFNMKCRYLRLQLWIHFTQHLWRKRFKLLSNNALLLQNSPTSCLLKSQDVVILHL